MSAQRSHGSVRVLLVGYNGANNTGADALLLADIADFKQVFGPTVRLTVPTLDEASLRRRLDDDPAVRIVPISPLFIRPVRRLVAEHDLVVLVEGSTYMDTWTSVLLWYFLWAARCAAAWGIPCLAYAVDAGTLNPLNRVLVRRVASATNMIIVRSEAAARRLRGWGVATRIEATADNAFTFVPRGQDLDLLDRAWPRHGRPVVGIAAVDFFRWPVRMRPYGKKAHLYRWPYYFSHSRRRAEAAAALAATIAAFADWLVEEYGAAVALLCMEQLDEPMAAMIASRMRHAERAATFSARHATPSQMTAVLRSLDYLVTSRFHAAVLSLAAAIPQIAIGHDLRLLTLYEDLGIRQEWFVSPDQAQLRFLKQRFLALRCDETAVQAHLRDACTTQITRAERNRALLARFARDLGLVAGP